MSRPTLLDVARAAGVSRSTVSYAYNQPARVSPAVRERVLAAAEELGYAGPDPAAASLRRGRTGALGVLFTEALGYAFADPAAVLFLRGIAEASERADVALTLLPVPPEQDGAMAAIRGSVIDGVIVYSLPPDHPAMEAVRRRRLPTVHVDMPGEPSVGIDDRGGARAVAAHVAELGHRRIAVLVDRLSADGFRGRATPEQIASGTFAVARERLGGYREALDLSATPVFDCAGNTVELGRAAALELLADEPRPTCILAITDQLARGVLAAAAELGLRIPQDLSVTGFDDLQEAAEADLTTVHQDHVGKGAAAARMLLEPGTGRSVRLPARLVVRGSTGPAPR